VGQRLEHAVEEASVASVVEPAPHLARDPLLEESTDTVPRVEIVRRHRSGFVSVLCGTVRKSR